MPIPLIERIQRTFPSAWFADAYGLTETVSGDTFLDRDSIIAKLGSVGRPCLYLELDIWDERGTRCRPGESGEIVLRGPKVFPGYWRDPEATAAAFAGGWFHTGDIGVRDEDGYLFIVDRLKDMIVSGGENIASSEVERVLYEHEAVLEAAVVGRPDERWGEIPVAFVVLRRRCRGHGRRAPRALPGPAGPLQGAQGGHLPRRAAPQSVRQGAQAGTAGRMSGLGGRSDEDPRGRSRVPEVGPAAHPIGSGGVRRIRSGRRRSRRQPHPPRRSGGRLRAGSGGPATERRGRGRLRCCPTTSCLAEHRGRATGAGPTAGPGRVVRKGEEGVVDRTPTTGTRHRGPDFDELDASDERRGYVPTDWRVLRKLFPGSVGPDDVLLEYGSGKGRVALWVASAFR